MAKEIKTTCPYCGVGCGVIVTVADDATVTVRGDENHPSNFGKLCSKGSALGETLGLEDRLLHPNVDGERVTWDTALDHVADRLSHIHGKYGADAIAFYASGQMLTEDYYVANKFMKGFLGTANIDTNSRLCMSSSVAGHKRAFGSDTVPGNYEDWDKADLVVLVGSNAAWCHPVLFQRLLRAKEERGTKIIVIDPRRTATCDSADLHLALKPGSDVRLFNGLLSYLAEHGHQDQDYVNDHTTGLDSALAFAQKDGINIAKECGLTDQELQEFYSLFARTKKVMTVYSQGVNQSSQGTDKVNAILNCHLLTGRIGQEGMGPFSITGQPNAMGGREVGGLANMLAAHMEFDEKSRDRVGRFWGSQTIAPKAGLKAQDMFRAVHSGKIKAIWIMATNPAVSMPDANFVREALTKCELVIVSDMMGTIDTLKYANVALPAKGWGEKNGSITNSERRISRQRSFIPAPKGAKADWWMICEVAKRMGFVDDFTYDSVFDVFLEHAKLSAFENDGARDFDLSGLTTLTSDGYDALEPVQWPVTDQSPAGTERFFAKGGFYTEDRRAKFIAVKSQKPVHAPDKEFPLILNSGRIRDHWHTMTRTGKSPRLNAHLEEPYLDIHPKDAADYQLDQMGFVNIKSHWGTALVRVHITENQIAGQVFMPMHWTDHHASNAVIGRLMNPVVDPVSGQPELKHTPVQIEKWQPKWHGFLLSAQRIKPKDCDYWAYSTQENCHILELAGSGDMASHPFLTPLFSTRNSMTLDHPTAGHKRMILAQNGKIEICLFTTHKGVLPDRSWLQSLFKENNFEPEKHPALLSGIPQDPSALIGPIVCACFGISEKAITQAFCTKKAATVNDIGELLKAGTNCGSCKPEIKELMTAALPS